MVCLGLLFIFPLIGSSRKIDGFGSSKMAETPRPMTSRSTTGWSRADGHQILVRNIGPHEPTLVNSSYQRIQNIQNIQKSQKPFSGLNFRLSQGFAQNHRTAFWSNKVEQPHWDKQPTAIYIYIFLICFSPLNHLNHKIYRSSQNLSIYSTCPGQRGQRQAAGWRSSENATAYSGGEGRNSGAESGRCNWKRSCSLETDWESCDGW